VLRFVDVYLIARVRNAVYQYNLKRVSRLVLWLVIAFFVLTIFFQNWYTAVVSFGLISLIPGFALQRRFEFHESFPTTAHVRVRHSAPPLASSAPLRFRYSFTAETQRTQRWRKEQISIDLR
jgi:hypothetical protein